MFVGALCYELFEGRTDLSFVQDQTLIQELMSCLYSPMTIHSTRYTHTLPIHFISQHSRMSSYTQLRIDISSTSLLPKIKSHIFGTPLLSPAVVFLPFPITLIPRGKNNYFKPHESFSLLGMFQNPMMVLMLLTGLMLLGLPYVIVRLFLCCMSVRAETLLLVPCVTYDV